MDKKLSGRPVVVWARVAAGAVVLIGTLALSMSLRSSPDDIAAAQCTTMDVLLVVYVLLLLGYVAIAGKTPDKYFPVASLSWPLIGQRNRPVIRWFRGMLDQLATHRGQRK